MQETGLIRRDASDVLRMGEHRDECEEELIEDRAKQ